MAKTTRSFDEIKCAAERLGKVLEAVQKSGLYDKRIWGLGSKLLNIATAMELIGATPNAVINRDALEAWSEQIDKAQTSLDAWMKDRLNPDIAYHDDGDDEIPY